MKKYVTYEIRPCVRTETDILSFASREEYREASREEYREWKRAHGRRADFWTLYGRFDDGTGIMLADAIGDFGSEESAREIMDAITGGTVNPKRERLDARSFAFDAMCIWEEFLDPVAGASYPGLEKYRSENGVCETRDRVLDMAEAANAIWKIMDEEEDGFDAPFDYEFVPLFLRHCTNATDEDAEDLWIIPEKEYQKAAAALVKIQRASEQESIARQDLDALRNRL